MLRQVTEGRIGPEEAVRAYHGVLQGRNIKPRLPLEKDLELTDQTMSYGGDARRTTATITNNPLATTGNTTPTDATSLPADTTPVSVPWPTNDNGAPDFAKMNSAQRVAYDSARLSRRFG
jgi:hypothetical protein